MSAQKLTNHEPRTFAGKQASVVDLFCGVGGLTHGFKLEGFHIAAGFDVDESCRYAYEYNNEAPFVAVDISDLEDTEINSYFDHDAIKILVGCAPCQPFSTYSRGKNASKGSQWRLLEKFSELIDAVKPDIVSMENVPELRRFSNGTVYQEFIDRLDSSYGVSEAEVYCPDYGIPQRRTRLVVIASRFGEVDLIEPPSTVQEPTVERAIADLEPISAGEISADDPLHRAAGLSEKNFRRIIQSKPGGSWTDWDDDLVAACHKRASGKTYRDVYGRMEWNQPSPTITTQSYGYGSGRFGHPVQHRALSLREAALLQTFPADYQFTEPDMPIYFKVTGRHIGNAVPVGLARVIAASIGNHLEQMYG